jgi:hypothetical protein
MVVSGAAAVVVVGASVVATPAVSELDPHEAMVREATVHPARSERRTKDWYRGFMRGESADFDEKFPDR